MSLTARLPARGVIISGQVESFPPVELAFAWTQSTDVSYADMRRW